MGQPTYLPMALVQQTPPVNGLALPDTVFDFDMVLYFPAQAAPSSAIMTSCAAVDGAPDPRPSLRPSELPVTSAPDHSFMPNGLAGFRRQVERITPRWNRTRAPRGARAFQRVRDAHICRRFSAPHDDEGTSMQCQIRPAHA